MFDQTNLAIANAVAPLIHDREDLLPASMIDNLDHVTTQYINRSHIEADKSSSQYVINHNALLAQQNTNPSSKNYWTSFFDYVQKSKDENNPMFFAGEHFKSSGKMIQSRQKQNVLDFAAHTDFELQKLNKQDILPALRPDPTRLNESAFPSTSPFHNVNHILGSLYKYTLNNVHDRYDRLSPQYLENLLTSRNQDYFNIIQNTRRQFAGDRNLVNQFDRNIKEAQPELLNYAIQMGTLIAQKIKVKDDMFAGLKLDNVPGNFSVQRPLVQPTKPYYEPLAHFNRLLAKFNKEHVDTIKSTNQRLKEENKLDQVMQDFDALTTIPTAVDKTQLTQQQISNTKQQIKDSKANQKLTVKQSLLKDQLEAARIQTQQMNVQKELSQFHFPLVNSGTQSKYQEYLSKKVVALQDEFPQATDFQRLTRAYRDTFDIVDKQHLQQNLDKNLVENQNQMIPQTRLLMQNLAPLIQNDKPLQDQLTHMSKSPDLVNIFQYKLGMARHYTKFIDDIVNSQPAKQQQIMDHLNDIRGEKDIPFTTMEQVKEVFQRVVVDGIGDNVVNRQIFNILKEVTSRGDSASYLNQLEKNFRAMQLMQSQNATEPIQTQILGNLIPSENIFATYHEEVQKKYKEEVKSRPSLGEELKETRKTAQLIVEGKMKDAFASNPALIDYQLVISQLSKNEYDMLIDQIIEATVSAGNVFTVPLNMVAWLNSKKAHETLLINNQESKHFIMQAERNNLTQSLALTNAKVISQENKVAAQRLQNEKQVAIDAVKLQEKEDKLKQAEDKVTEDKRISGIKIAEQKKAQELKTQIFEKQSKKEIEELTAKKREFEADQLLSIDPLTKQPIPERAAQVFVGVEGLLQTYPGGILSKADEEYNANLMKQLNADQLQKRTTLTLKRQEEERILLEAKNTTKLRILELQKLAAGSKKTAAEDIDKTKTAQINFEVEKARLKAQEEIKHEIFKKKTEVEKFELKQEQLNFFGEKSSHSRNKRQQAVEQFVDILRLQGHPKANDMMRNISAITQRLDYLERSHHETVEGFDGKPPHDRIKILSTRNGINLQIQETLDQFDQSLAEVIPLIKEQQHINQLDLRADDPFNDPFLVTNNEQFTQFLVRHGTTNMDVITPALQNLNIDQIGELHTHTLRELMDNFRNSYVNQLSVLQANVAIKQLLNKFDPSNKLRTFFPHSQISEQVRSSEEQLQNAKHFYKQQQNILLNFLGDLKGEYSLTQAAQMNQIKFEMKQKELASKERKNEVFDEIQNIKQDQQQQMLINQQRIIREEADNEVLRQEANNNKNRILQEKNDLAQQNYNWQSNQLVQQRQRMLAKQHQIDQMERLKNANEDAVYQQKMNLLVQNFPLQKQQMAAQQQQDKFREAQAQALAQQGKHQQAAPAAPAAAAPAAAAQGKGAPGGGGGGGGGGGSQAQGVPGQAPAPIPAGGKDHESLLEELLKLFLEEDPSNSRIDMMLKFIITLTMLLIQLKRSHSEEDLNKLQKFLEEQLPHTETQQLLAKIEDDIAKPDGDQSIFHEIMQLLEQMSQSDPKAKQIIQATHVVDLINLL